MFYRRQIPARSIALLLMDVVVVFLAMLLACLTRLGPTVGWPTFLSHIPSGIGVSILFTLVFYAAGMYEPITLARPRSMMLVALSSILAGMVMVVLAFYALFRIRHLGLGINVLTFVYLFIGTVMTRHLFRMILGTRFFVKPALIVGEGRELQDIVDLVKHESPQPLFNLMGIVVPGNEEPRERFLHGVPVLGRRRDLHEFVEAYNIEVILVATSQFREAELLKSLRPLRYRGVALMDFVSLHEMLANSIPLDHIDDEWLMHAAMNSSRVHIRKMKRVLDVFVAVTGLILTLPISLLAALAIRLDSAGPVFYRQRRLGLAGAPFTVTKFRTMTQDAERESGAVWADRYDNRITRVGRFLRSTRIDEIPQLLNVLAGQMSLVGPRPERPEFVDNLKKQIPFYEERLMMPPGITGWAQVSYPYAASVTAARHKLQYDLYYIKHTSLFFDLAILLRTFKTILVGMRHSGKDNDTATKPPEMRVVEPLRETAG